ncbi:BZ3500_MvSof-1268-A1-R1_Chr8-2g10108 [Microbotryum saponariae]|uniref:BZ3500_MvSof-1268-A1-R1_Chr8-2g10108 protein n=1 Tax=Microbotryum saponariae TaxID=289078 RepID=A0A2X0MPS1_9BASI|nr:BZ3500_MvSof-1268-A1-R1_Chr8-2g10108 [Microbotryum saponariae]SDA01802.1 BZ3501_MvSof-1269-A2-R1_Chr8-2g09859 [Microbotryum saponariae]
MDNIDSYWSMQDDAAGNQGYSPGPSASHPPYVARTNSQSRLVQLQQQQQHASQQHQHPHQQHQQHLQQHQQHLNRQQQQQQQHQQQHQQQPQHHSSSTYGLSPSALDPSSFSSQFILPRFASGGPGDAFGFGVAVAEATNPGNSNDYKNPGALGMRSSGLMLSNSFANLYSSSAPTDIYGAFGSGAGCVTDVGYEDATQLGSAVSASGIGSTPSLGGLQANPANSPVHGGSGQQQLGSGMPSQTGVSRPVTANQTSTNGSATGPNSAVSQPAPALPMHASEGGPVYAPYGSSIISINSNSPTGYKMPAQAVAMAPSQAPPPGSTYEPASLGLPVPPPAGESNNFAGLYSSSGFDMLGVLARVVARPNPQLSIGAVDTSCAFLVVDAKRWDQPIVFASETFTRMTGYPNDEIIGKNCRFLQAPTGSQAQGAPRKYTDSNAAWHMRVHIASGKESQSSLINYKKDGKPFINLVTIIPIAWDSDEITYFVGFQVDLVDQPNAILDRMKDGTYVVNYSLYNNTGTVSMPSHRTTISMASIEDRAGVAEEGTIVPTQGDDIEWEMTEEDSKANVVAAASAVVTGARRGSLAAAAASTTSLAPSKGELDTLEVIERDGLQGLESEEDRRSFHKLLLSEADDFIHVLSLKGSFLYCSPSIASVLEYQPSELIGKTLPTLCHPSDVVPVMRLLKDTSTIHNSTVSLLYRIRRKHSGYIWLEASGKLHIEPGKGRKCVIFVGRPREVMRMSWTDLNQAGGVGDTEFWMGVSPGGTILSATSAVESMLGRTGDEMMGMSLQHLAAPEHVPAIEQALQQCADGVASTVRYRFQNQLRSGFTDVVTRFYPRAVDELEEPITSSNFHCNILAQTNEVGSEQRKNAGPFASISPVYRPVIGSSSSNVLSPMSDSESSSTPSSPPPFQSTFKTLAHPSAISDNVFDELESRRPTSWQFELHQLQITNKKLRDEKEHLIVTARKRGFVFGQRARSEAGWTTPLSRRKASSDGGSSRASTKTNGGRGCANCGRFDSPEWRAGPTGAKTLCNRCGLRWAKTQKQETDGSAIGSLTSASPGPSVGGTSASSSFTPYSASSDAMQWQ